MINKLKAMKLKGAGIVRSYLCSTIGASAVIISLTMPAILGSMGMAIDTGQIYLAKKRLEHAIDAAALAAAGSSSLTEAEVIQRVKDFIKANYTDEELGEIIDIKVTIGEDNLVVSASVTVNTIFLNILGINSAEASTDTKVVREVRGLEVMMVLDVTGSMSTNNNIAALRTAATSFVDILYERSSDDDTIKIGMVPYSSAVNVGPYGLGLTPDGDTYGDPFVDAPDPDRYMDDSADITFNQSDKFQWHGCVLARDYPEDTLDSEADWTWEMYRSYFNDSKSSNTRYYADYYNNSYGGNYQCNKAYVVPLTTDSTYLKEKISELTATGYTYGNLGMVWGYRLLSPNFPFQEGAAFEDLIWQKVAVMMTDGNNTMNSHYSAYGGTRTHDVSVTDLNERFEETCTEMKKQGIQIYTVTFTSGVSDNTRGYYERCASDATKYFDAPSQDDLVETFEQISKELSNLYIMQ
jgi:Flp pilus assembly protein TadG